MGRSTARLSFLLLKIVLFLQIMLTAAVLPERSRDTELRAWSLRGQVAKVFSRELFQPLWAARRSLAGRRATVSVAEVPCVH